MSDEDFIYGYMAQLAGLKPDASDEKSDIRTPSRTFVSLTIRIRLLLYTAPSHPQSRNKEHKRSA